MESLSPSSPEYDKVAKYITSSYPNACIMFIDKIKNHPMNPAYEEYKSKMNKPTEMVLFHGTKKSAVDSIIGRGYDESYGKVMAYGRGLYFSKSAAYSSKYMDTKKEQSGHEISHMFVNKVLVGTSCQGMANKVIDKAYDSATDSMLSPTMYVVPSGIQAIPEYLVGFYTGT